MSVLMMVLIFVFWVALVAVGYKIGYDQALRGKPSWLRKLGM